GFYLCGIGKLVCPFKERPALFPSTRVNVAQEYAQPLRKIITSIRSTAKRLPRIYPLHIFLDSLEAITEDGISGEVLSVTRIVLEDDHWQRFMLTHRQGFKSPEGG